MSSRRNRRRKYFFKKIFIIEDHHLHHQRRVQALVQAQVLEVSTNIERENISRII